MDLRDDFDDMQDAENVLHAINGVNEYFKLNSIPVNIQVSALASWILTYFINSHTKKDFENFVHFLITSYMKSYAEIKPILEKEENGRSET